LYCLITGAAQELTALLAAFIIHHEHLPRMSSAPPSTVNYWQPKRWTRCSAIAERPRCRVRYSFRQK